MQTLQSNHLDYSEFTIAEASPKDYQAFAVFHLMIFGKNYYVPAHRVENWLKSRNEHLYLMWRGTQLIGSVIVCSEWDSDLNPITSLWSVGINPLYQGKGLGEYLLQNVMSEREAIWELYVFEENIRARRLYERLGFVSYETLGLESNTRPGVMHYRLQP